MGIEYKNVSVSGVTKVKDEGKGVVTAYVSVTGLEDNVKDIIEPGAYTKTLQKRKPKGAWGHDWKTPTAKTLEIVELKPGHKDLPKTLSNGQPWPQEAGALKVKMKFNLGSSRGRDAYSDVMFFKDEQEWSIGYSVPDGGSYKKGGIRYIKELDLFEYSPVLFGAMTHARTASVKDAQFGMRMLNGATAEEVKGWEAQLIEFKKAVDEAEEGTDPEGVEEPDEDDWDEEGGEYVDDDDEDDDDDEEKSEDIALLARQMIEIGEKMLATMGEPLESKNDDDDAQQQWLEGAQAYIEAKAASHATVAEAVDETDEDDDELQEAAEEFDAAVAAEDVEAAEKAATELLDLLESSIESAEKSGRPTDLLNTVAMKVAIRLQDLDLDQERVKTAKTVTIRGTRYERHDFKGSSNDFGVVYAKDGSQPSGRLGMRAFVALLDDGPLMALKGYVDGETDDTAVAMVVDRELQGRDIKMDGGAGHPMEDANKPKRKRGKRRDKYENEDTRRRGTGRVGPRQKDDEGKVVTLDLSEFKDLGDIGDLISTT